MSGTDATPEGGRARLAAGAPEIRLPARLNMKRALDIYVSGRARSLGPLQKEAVVDERTDTPVPHSSTQASDRAPDILTSTVSVPATLCFERSAGIWPSLGPLKGGSR